MSMRFEFNHHQQLHSISLKPAHQSSKKTISVGGKDYKLKGKDEDVSLLMSCISSLPSRAFDSLSSLKGSVEKLEQSGKLDEIFQKSFNLQRVDNKSLEDSLREVVPSGAGAMVALKEKGRPLEMLVLGKTRVNGQQVDGQTAALIGSGAKMFTALLSMVLCEKGVISLDSKLSDFMSEQQMHIFQDREKAKEITLGMLLSHTSGLQYFADDNHPERKGMPLDAIILGMKSESIRFIANPGDKIYSYSNQIELAAFMIEKAYAQKTGKALDYAGIIREELLEPLGMNRTGFDKPQDENVLQCYSRGRSIEDEVLDPLMRGAGGMWSCMDDMLKLASAYRMEGIFSSSGEPLISSAGVQKLAEKQGINGSTGFGINVSGNVVGKGGSIYTYSFNFQVNPVEGDTLVSFCNFANEGSSATDFTDITETAFAKVEPSFEKQSEVPVRKAKSSLSMAACDQVFKGDRGYVAIQHIVEEPGLRVNWNGQSLAIQKVDANRYLILDSGYPHGQVLQEVIGEKSGSRYVIIEKPGETSVFQEVDKHIIPKDEKGVLIQTLQTAQGEYPSVKAPGMSFHFKINQERPCFTINDFPYVEGLVVDSIEVDGQIREVWFMANCADFPPDKLFKLIRDDAGSWAFQVTDFINPENVNETISRRNL